MTVVQKLEKKSGNSLGCVAPLDAIAALLIDLLNYVSSTSASVP